MAEKNDITFRIFGFQIQHLFPLEILTGDTDNARAAKAFIEFVGFNLEAAGEKSTVESSDETIDQFETGAMQPLLPRFTKAGRAWHMGMHVGYNIFMIETLSRFHEQKLDPIEAQFALGTLITFLRNMHATETPIFGYSPTQYQQAWERHLISTQYKGTTVPATETTPLALSTL